MMSVDVQVGRVLELRLGTPLSADELSDFVARVRSAVSKATQPLVICTDLRAVDALDPTATDSIIWMMRRDNPNVHKNALLFTVSSPFGIQLAKMLNQAGTAQRKAFDDVAKLIRWITPDLSPVELARVRAFFMA